MIDPSFLVFLLILSGILFLAAAFVAYVMPIIRGGKVKNLVVKKPNFEAQAEGLARLEIWAVPVGKEAKEDHKLISEGTMVKEEKGEQTWIAPIPPTPVVASRIYARGVNRWGGTAEEFSLPISNAAELYNTVWGDAGGPVLIIGSVESIEPRTKTINVKTPAGARIIVALDVNVQPMDTKGNGMKFEELQPDQEVIAHGTLVSENSFLATRLEIKK
jgi:hypothetical protein